MKKKIITILVCGVMVLGIISLGIIGFGTKGIKKSEKPKEIVGISMTIKEGTLTNTSATIIIKNEYDTDNNNLYDAWFRIDKKIIGKWRTLKEKNEKYSSIDYWVDPNNKSELNFDWINKYGKLERGHYRFVKKINNEYVATEFSIE